MFKKVILLITVLVLIAILAIPQWGCSSASAADGIQIKDNVVTVDNSICKFSFAFTGNYTINDPYIEENAQHQTTSFDLNLPKKKSPLAKEVNSGYYCPAVISIDVYDYLDQDECAKSELMSYLNRVQKEKSFKLIYVSHMFVSKIPAYQLMFLDGGIPYSQETGWNRRVYFNHDGLIWRLSVTCDQNINNTVGADFEQILSSFKLLK